VKRGVATALLVALLLSLLSCSHGREVRALACDEVVILTIVENRQMAILLFEGVDRALFDGVAIEQCEAEGLDELVSVLQTLAAVERSGDSDGQALVDLLIAGAPTLRKTRLADTLATVSGEGDSFTNLAKMKSAELFDLRGRISADGITDEWLHDYIDEVRRYMRRR
jgi:hypothetical protein